MTCCSHFFFSGGKQTFGGVFFLVCLFLAICCHIVSVSLLRLLRERSLSKRFRCSVTPVPRPQLTGLEGNTWLKLDQSGFSNLELKPWETSTWFWGLGSPFWGACGGTEEKVRCKWWSSGGRDWIKCSEKSWNEGHTEWRKMSVSIRGWEKHMEAYESPDYFYFLSEIKVKVFIWKSEWKGMGNLRRQGELLITEMGSVLTKGTWGVTNGTRGLPEWLNWELTLVVCFFFDHFQLCRHEAGRKWDSTRTGFSARWVWHSKRAKRVNYVCEGMITVREHGLQWRRLGYRWREGEMMAGSEIPMWSESQWYWRQEGIRSRNTRVIGEMDIQNTDCGMRQWMVMGWAERVDKLSRDEKIEKLRGEGPRGII